MANFLLQKDIDDLEIENIIVKGLLKRNKYVHSYSEMLLNELNDKNIESGLIPIGTIEFVTNYLRKAYDFDKENPIEIPKYLRTDEFLKRDYKITTWDNIPRNGIHFIKNASTLKDFSYCGNMSYFITDDMFEQSKSESDTSLRLSKDDLYVVSSEFDILSEYRVYVMNGEVSSIANYNGNPLILPDINLLNKVLLLIKFNEKWLKSYTIDLMVGKEGTAIIEIHNFASVGLYNTLAGNELLWAYRDGIDYLLNDNRKIEV